MNVVMERAKSSWLLAFGDVITLLITFFIMMIALNKGEISRVQAWVEKQVNQSYEVLNQSVIENRLEVIKVNRTARGIVLTIQSDNAFESGRFQPTEQLEKELSLIGKMLSQTPLLNIENNPENSAVIKRAKEDGMQWNSEVIIEGHTDNDKIDPLSRLRNNFFLSTLRAQSVMQTLFESSQLPAERFSVGGYGEWQPLVNNDSEIAKRYNRRVGIILTASFQQIAE